MAMGSTHRTTTARRRRGTATGTAIAALATIGLVACSGGGDDDASSATIAGAEFAPTTTIPAGATPLDSESAGDQSARAAVPVPAASGPAAAQVIGQALAMTAHATVQADDVPTAVRIVRTSVTTRGGRVSAEDVDYGAPASEDGEDPGRAARATLVVAVPPGEVDAVRDSLDDVGEVQSFEQQAEDVADQLTDLDTRISNQRASVARIRELYATATDVEAIVRIEGELTNRETALEQLLAMQANLQGRVAMSTLTIDITATPAAAATTDDGDGGTSIGDALGAGWSAFAGALFAIALVLTAAMPFLLLVAGVGLVVWLVLRRTRRVHTPVTAPAAEDPERQEAVASRQG
jgi:hypothetical protein